MRFIVQKHEFLILSAILVFVAYFSTIWFQLHAPDKFYIDSWKILNEEFNDGSYWFSQIAYYPLTQLITFFDLSYSNYGFVRNSDFVLINSIQYLMAAIFFLVSLYHVRTKIDQYDLLLLTLMLAVSAPFMATVSKEHIVMLAATILVFVSAKPKFNSTFIIVFVLLGIFFRKYYIIYVVLYFLIYVMRSKPKLSLAVSVFSLFVMYFLYIPFLYDHVIHLRNQNLIPDTVTWINYYFSDDEYIGFIVNRMLAFVRILFPVELLLLGNLIYIPFVILKTLISLKCISLFLTTKDIVKFRVSTMYIAFSLTGALFEPDFGSVTRHMIGILPLLILILGNNKYAKN